MRIPLERASEGMKDADKTRDKVFGLIQGEKNPFDDIGNGLEETIKQRTVFEKKGA